MTASEPALISMRSTIIDWWLSTIDPAINNQMDPEAPTRPAP